ncbi:MAG: hypothetical protein GX601_01450 [Anaerolineales bacterium]|nr:hypothetical protein [Anaerolineales bacterium]
MTGNPAVVLPTACLFAGAFLVYLVARFITTRNVWLATLTAVPFLAALVALARLWPQVSADRLPRWGYLGPDGAFLQADPGALMLIGVVLGLGLLVTIFSGHYLSLDQRYETYYPLLLLLATGLTALVLAADLFTLYLCCELAGVAAYVLVAFRRRTDTAIEAGFKYLVMGSVGTIALLMGIAFIYRGTGSTALVQPGGAASAWVQIGAAGLLLGLGVKSAVVPLHTWLPDAHGRAPSSISAMLSGIVVQCNLYALIKAVLGVGLPASGLGTLLIGLSLANMVVGNTMALVQTHTKRLLAYSTVTQIGYIMLTIGIGLRSGQAATIGAGFFLLLASGVMKALAFLCKGTHHFYSGGTTIAELRGAAVSMPLVAGAFVVALAGMAGVPPLVGFTAKWFALKGMLASGDLVGYLGLAVFLVNSLLALGYYLPLIGTLFAKPPAPTGRVAVSTWMVLPVVALAALTVALGLVPGPWLDWAEGAGAYLIGLSARLAAGTGG